MSAIAYPLHQQRPKARFGGAGPKAPGQLSGPASNEAAASKSRPADPASQDGISTAADDGDLDTTQPHLLPKVLAPHVTKPGATPRKVLIQRKRRLYAAQDIQQLVEQLGLPCGPGCCSNLSFGLELFDDSSYDTRNPQEWMPAAAAGPANVPARAANITADGSISWSYCLVQQYKADSGLYLVHFDQRSAAVAAAAAAAATGAAAGGEVEAGRAAGSSSSPPPAQQSAWLPRVHICFLAEDPALYAQRFVAAHAGADAAQQLLRYQLICDTMPVDDVPQLPPEQVQRVMSSALNSKRLRDQFLDASSLVTAANLDHQRALNRATLDDVIRRPDADRGAQLLPLPSVPPDQLQQGIWAPKRRKVGARGTVDMPPDFNFAEQYSEFSFRTLLTKVEVIQTLGKIRSECAKLQKMCMFSTHSSKSVRLEEWEQSQLAAMDTISNYLKDNWLVSIKNIIKAAFKDIGKGWYNLSETNWHTYEFSKLRRLLLLVRLIMEDTLRMVGEDSMVKFNAFLKAQGCCSSQVDVKSTSDIVYSGDAGKRLPLLTAELMVTPDGTTFCYSTPPDLIHTKALALFDRALQKLQGLPQLEPAIMDKLFWPNVPNLTAVHLQEQVACSNRDQLSTSILVALQPIRKYLQLYAPYEYLLSLNPDTYVEQLAEKGSDLSLSQVKQEVVKHERELELMEQQLPASVCLGLVQVNCNKVRDHLLRVKSKLVLLLKGLAARIPRALLSAASFKASELEKQLKSKPSSIEEVDAQRRFIEELPGKLVAVAAEVEAAKPWYEALETMRYLLPDTDAREKLIGESWQVKLMRQGERTLETLDAEEARFTDEMVAEQEAFMQQTAGLQAAVAAVAQRSDMQQIDAVAADVRKLEAQLRSAERAAQTFNSREGVLGRPLTDYSFLKQLADSFDPYMQFWATAADWQAQNTAWMGSTWDKLNGETVEKQVTSAYKTLYKMNKVFAQRGQEQMATNCDAVRHKVEDFKTVVPLVQALSNPGMRPRHWEQLSKDLGQTVQPDATFTLAAALQQGLQQNLDTITRVADNASKEYSIEQALEKLVNEWEGAELMVIAYRETGTFVVKVEEALSQGLDDAIVMLQSMQFSPYKKPFEEKLAKWDAQLNLVSEVIEQWLQLQRNWMYLEPIFSSPDIMQQLPMEGKRFAAVDRSWRKTLDGAKKNPNMLKVCASQKLLDQFTESNKLLDSVQKGLANYLETKRLAFARFFFLSNDELLQILSQAKNPLAVQPHLRKCFEAIASLDFAPDQTITAMNSAEKEKVPFDKAMAPTGSVEIWLGEVERRMIASVRTQTMASMSAYASRPRPAWTCEWPAMVVLAVSQIYWARGVEQAVADGAVDKYLEQCTSDLMDLTDLVRGQLTDQQRMTLGALITVDVHARDVVQELVDAGLQQVTDFEWVSRLRYYWRDDVWVDMVQASLKYGYEYLGNSPRLVITPLTDRCYMTLMSAMHLNLGGAPAGPAGTGKTETTKDLAKAMAKQCVVFNCSDGLDYLAMGKFFKGLASSGAWACFDEFNRIDLEVLSVIAQQILTIQLAIQAKLKRFIFEDTEIDLNPACAVYITMNPGYAGRSELPDNLKALFRPCAMMVPDYALIAEICLYSYGYRNAKALARKMVATFKLCSEQLSSQDHYDYGMRAVKSVITAAGNLKRASPQEDEEVLLLRSLRDVNVPKFLSHDLPLFDGIITDLFPGVKPPDVDYKDLMAALHQACAEQNLQPEPSFLAKVIQLHETTLVRHGLMLVGPTMAGKTSAYRALATACTTVANNGSATLNKVRTLVLNPKSITMGQLYGQFDENTHEWTDGVAACLMREAADDTTPDKKWLMFDGPVDALWIESMNTVLDDNKKLCLVSGEIIQMSNSMTMMFEVEDLAVASPATVSRCGMVYMEPGALGWGPLLASWLQRLPPALSGHLEALRAWVTALLPDGLTLVRKQLKETVASAPHSLVAGCFNLVDALLAPLLKTGAALPKGDTAGLPQMLLFAVTWSLGATCDRSSRAKFDQWLRSKAASTAGDPAASALAAALPPADAPVYDWCWDAMEKQWVPWMKTVPEFKCDPELPFAQITVPTLDTIRYTYLLDVLLSAGKHILCVGETGTGKTLTVANKLLNAMPPEVQPIMLTFSARTSANQTQDIIDAKMDKRRKGVYGPPSGKKAVIFVDDLNMPQRERYFAQPPLELLRQWFDHSGWYERKPPCAFRALIDTQLVAAMGPPGGGRNPVTARLLRHFHNLSFTELSDDSLKRIFGTILDAFFTRKGFNPAVLGATQQLVASTVQLYNSIREEMLPTPAKSHYTFNLRDLSKVVQGLMRAEPSTCPDVKQVLALWLHEASRVFEDRLTCAQDHQWFRSQQEQLLRQQFDLAYSDVVTRERLVYGDYLVPGAEPKVYAPATDLGKLSALMESYLEDYNSTSTSPMKLVCFLDAIEHVSRICRVLRQPLGHVLLLGVGGSGRQSLARLAAFICDYEVVQVEIAKGYGNNEWREDLKRVLKKAGLEGKDTVFLFSDTQIVQESFLEDINSILNSGEVPNLMGNDDQEQIAAAMRPLMTAAGLPMSKPSINAFFVDRIRACLHLVLCFSPVGDAFRQRLRMFPALVNCTTIDWFSEWPVEALSSVAKSFLADVELGSDPDALDGVVKVCVGIHKCVEAKSRRYLEELRRYNYVTPTSYLELLGTFLRLLGDKRDELGASKRRLEAGLDKLTSTAAQVEVMQKELQELQPVLTSTAEEVERMMTVIAADKEEAAVTKAKVEQQERDANAQAATAKSIAEDAQKDLDAALPALDAAVASLKNLSRNDVVEVKSLSNPPAGVKLVMEVTCIMFDEKPKMKDDPNKMGKKVPDYWDASKKLLNDPSKFLDSLLTYDKDNIPDATIQKVEPYIAMEEFTPAAVSKVSKACTSICMWARAMFMYHNVALSVAPKRAALAAAQETLNATLADLQSAQERLQAVEQKIATLEAQFAEATAKKASLAAQVADCQVKLQRADKLIGGLGGERTRWQATVKQLQLDLHNVVGDVVVASGVIAYSGPFVPNYRTALLSEWGHLLEAARVPASKGANLIRTLADPVAVRAWTIAGLPTDTQSVENGIIVHKARRWPLMIDPQGQANKWVRNMERDHGLEVVKLNNKDMLRTLENAVRFGRPVLLEDVGQVLDAALEPLLLRQTFKQGGSMVIKIGDSIIPYHQDFKFYMTTKLRNPHYPPEVCVKVSLLNFFVTPEGLEEQLLGTVVTQERPDLADLKNMLVVSNAKMKADLAGLESKILELLSNSSGNILEDEALINMLAQAKITSNEVAARVAEAEATEAEIDATRELYRPVAVRASLLFFAISELAGVDPMYQYSLSWFASLFIRGIAEAPKADSVAERGENLNEYFTASLYTNVCCSLFERHKLLFSFLLTIKIQQHTGMIDAREWRFLLAGPPAGSKEGEDAIPNPASDWLTDKSWQDLLALSDLPAFAGFAKHMIINLAHYKAMFDSNQVHTMPLAAPFATSLTPFQFLLMLRCLRPDKVLAGIQNYVAASMGQHFIEPPPFDLKRCFKESQPSTPLIFVLSPGADPMADLLALAEELRMSKRFEKVSLGQGQGPKAEKLLEAGMEAGLWVCLQNCHLAVSWMPSLERIVQDIQPEKVHKDFRLWLTSMPSPSFPVSLLQEGVKMTLEPPAGLRANLLRQYNRLSEADLAGCTKPLEWRRLLLGMCLFHAVIQDRRKFGALGWNIRYDFTDGDLNVSLAQMKEYLEKYEEVPYRVLRFLFTEINYGGRVTDDKDRRLINSLILKFCAPEVLQDGYRFSDTGTYYMPECETVKQFTEYIRGFPLVPGPEIFGLHENADITCEQNETYALLGTLLALQPRASGGGSSGGGPTQEEVISGLAQSILHKLPPAFDVEAVGAAYPTVYTQSMNTVLCQECIRYNGLLGVMRSSLRETLKALKGLVVMSPDLEAVAYALYDNLVPEAWAAKAYPSLKPLSTWVTDLLQRLEFIQGWVDHGVPVCYWISGFFFPQAFLTGTLQNYARHHKLPIDTVVFTYEVMDGLEPGCTTPPPEGCYIRGLHMEGARWDAATHCIGESRPKELFSEMPWVWLRPCQQAPASHAAASSGGDQAAPQQQQQQRQVYACPVYKTLSRAGTLSTTGHSTNFIMMMDLPSTLPSSHWIDRGVALFTALAF